MAVDESNQAQPVAFGLIVIGDEVLNGERSDKHLARFKTIFSERGHSLAWHWVLPDDPLVLVDHLRFSMSRPDPVFVCGGIGATPDDHTRACAAESACIPLERHPEAKALIEERFGAEAYPYRILMADLPAGCELISNPYNKIPGFRVSDHFFLPGFPQMAWPMAEATLDRYYPAANDMLRELSVIVRGVPESRLVPVMETLRSLYPRVKVFSLPHLGDDPHVLLGLRGREGVDDAYVGLRDALRREGITFSTSVPAGTGSDAHLSASLVD